MKENDKAASYLHLHKYYNTVLYGLQWAYQPMPMYYYLEMEVFLLSSQKEAKKQRKLGNTDEHEADPIPWLLYCQVCSWAVYRGNIFLWFFTVLQWNCIEHSVNIDGLGLHNFLLGGDLIKVEYDNTTRLARTRTPKSVCKP